MQPEQGAGGMPPMPLLSMQQSTSLARPRSELGGHGGCHGPPGVGVALLPSPRHAGDATQRDSGS